MSSFNLTNHLPQQMIDIVADYLKYKAPPTEVFDEALTRSTGKEKRQKQLDSSVNDTAKGLIGLGMAIGNPKYYADYAAFALWDYSPLLNNIDKEAHALLKIEVTTPTYPVSIDKVRIGDIVKPQRINEEYVSDMGPIDDVDVDVDVEEYPDDLISIDGDLPAIPASKCDHSPVWVPGEGFVDEAFDNLNIIDDDDGLIQNK